MQKNWMRKRGIVGLMLAMSALSASGQSLPDGKSPQAIPAAVVYPVKITRDVAFYTTKDTQLKMDVFQPDTTSPALPGRVNPGSKRPGILLIHGGGFVGGDKSFYTPLCRHFAERGYLAFSINYRLAPLWHYPAQIDDAQRAVRWIRAHAADYGLDPDKLGAFGDSAGGYLAALLGLRDTRDNSDSDLAAYSSRVNCVVDLYGPTDFTVPAKSKTVSKEAIFLLQLYFGKSQEQAPDLYREASVIPYIGTNTTPFLILHGSEDTLVPSDQSERFYDALKEAKIDATLLLFYKLGHGFLHPGDPKQVGVLADEFFDRRLKP